MDKGMLSNEIKDQYRREMIERARDSINIAAPGGESPARMVARVVAAANEIGARQSGETVMIVAHGVCLAALICLSQEIPLECLYENIPENAKLLHVEWRPPVEMNDISKWLCYRSL